MSNSASQLLQKVKESIQLRASDIELYRNSFSEPDSFITATIGGQQEFVPISLLCQNHDQYQTLLDLYQVFGTPASNEGLNGRLKEFYGEHGIDWPTHIDENNVTYYVKPSPKSASSPLFDPAAIEKLSAYAGTNYKASDAFLKDLGNIYASEIVDKTNKWGESISLPNGYIIELERYWQVAGRFKSFTWAKVYKEVYKDKKIFFSVGVDVQNKEIIIKLDVLRSGTHKLSNFEIRDFDYLTAGKELVLSYSLDQIEELSLDELTFIVNQFIANTQKTYEQAINFIWNDTIECSLYRNKLFKLSNKYTSESPLTSDNVIEKDVAQLIIAFEKFILTHAGREALAESIEIESEGELQIVKSFETDGKPKTILYKTTNGGTNAAFEMSREEIEYLGNNLHTFLYHIVEYNADTNCGKLIIRKGSPTKYAELKSINYEVKIG